jgi:hypothetical protein
MLPQTLRFRFVMLMLRLGSALALALGSHAAIGGAAATALDLSRLAELPAPIVIERVMASQIPEVQQLRAKLIAAAQMDADKSVLVRPTTLAGLSKWRVPLKYATRPSHMNQLGAAEWEQFCLSQGDGNAGFLLTVELPRLAAAAAMPATRL